MQTELFHDFTQSCIELTFTFHTIYDLDGFLCISNTNMSFFPPSGVSQGNTSHPYLIYANSPGNLAVVLFSLIGPSCSNVGHIIW